MKINKKIIIFTFIIVAALTATIYYLFWHKSNILIDGQKLTANISFSIQEKKYVQLLFVGDLMFDRGIRYYAGKSAKAGGAGNDFIFEKINQTLSENDLVVANLEGPITDNKSISAGTKPGVANNYLFTFDPSVAETLFKKNIKLVNLGNNHILNFGRKGLASTKKYLDNAKVGYFGAPDFPKSASKEIGGVKITFINYNEFSTIGETEQKATIEEIQKAKNYSDIIIVFSHWGNEYELVPTGLQRNLAHQFINAGANLIIGSHPHVIQTIEEYNGKKIYYSLGNFIFDQYFSEDVRNGLGVVVKVNKQTKQLEFSEKHFYLSAGGQTIEK